MVYFECQKCNETVKKPKLAKHLSFCGSGFVSCIDCCKVFAWNEWEAHTSCISENQKYQGNLFQAKDNVNKGQQKQDAWTENVRQKINDPSVAAHMRSSLEKLLGFDNIPRKQKPFGNFIKNSLKIWDERRITEIWEVIGSANAAPKPAVPQAAPAKEAAAATPAAPEPATPKNEACDGSCKKNGWGGWKRALDEVLDGAGGELPWKRLRDDLVERRVAAGDAKAGDARLGLEALASIPESYLSSKDDMVRRPKH